jgi:hypothetical protein
MPVRRRRRHPLDSSTKGMTRPTSKPPLAALALFAALALVLIFGPGVMVLPPFALIMAVMMGGLALCAAVELALGDRAERAARILRSLFPRARAAAEGSP